MKFYIEVRAVVVTTREIEAKSEDAARTAVLKQPDVLEVVGVRKSWTPKEPMNPMNPMNPIANKVDRVFGLDAAKFFGVDFGKTEARVAAYSFDEYGTLRDRHTAAWLEERREREVARQGLA